MPLRGPGLVKVKGAKDVMRQAERARTLPAPKPTSTGQVCFNVLCNIPYYISLGGKKKSKHTQKSR